MLGIILFIFKLLGIILLVILGLILLVLVLVLFAPVKYKGSGSKYGDDLRILALVTYLNPVIRVTVQYPNAHIVNVKICSFTVFSTGEDEKLTEENMGEEKIHAKEETEEKEKHSFESDSVVEQECQHQASKESGKAEKEGNPQSGSALTSGESVVSTDNIQEESETEDTNKTDDSILDTVGYYVSLLQKNKALILNVLQTILNALKTILPRKCRIKAMFGAGEADKTGFIYAAYCALEDYLPGEIIFEPVWTEKFAEGEFELQGRIRLIHFLVAAVKIIANKNVRLLIKKIRRV